VTQSTIRAHSRGVQFEAEEQTMNTHVPLRSILLATNLADIDWLFPFTCSLAEESGAHVTLVHVVSAWNGFTTDLAGNPYYNPTEAFDAATSYLKAACCRDCSAKVKSEVIAIDGSPADGILTMAKQVEADLLVMGTSCNRGVDKWLHGSVAEHVLRSSPIPVVTVGPKAHHAAASGRPIKSILFATSLLADSTDKVNLSVILKWVERLHGHLMLLHVLPDERTDSLAQERNCKAREKQLRSLLPEKALRDGLAHACVRIGSPSREILAAADNADLITLGALRNPMLRRFAAEGTLYKVLAEAHCPVATLHSEHPRLRMDDFDRQAATPPPLAPPIP
jgi:nucleotide-binding universal stress UspA family protein